MEEPASVEALRTIKSELLAVELQYRQAEAALQQALAEEQVLLNKLKELELAKATAENEQELLRIEQAMEEMILNHQLLLLEKKEELAYAEQNYAEALAVLAEEAKGLSSEERNMLDSYLYKLEEYRTYAADSQEEYQNAVNNYVNAQYSFAYDFEVYKAKYLADVNAAKVKLENATEFQTLVAELHGSEHYQAASTLRAEIEAKEKEIQSLKDAKTIYAENAKKPLNEESALLDNETIENEAKITDLQLQQKHLFLDNEAFYKRTVSVPDELANELYNWFYNNDYEDNALGFIKDQKENKWGTANQSVTVQFEFPTNTSNYDVYDLKSGEMATFLNDLKDKYASYANSADNVRANYYATVNGYLTEFNSNVTSAQTKYDELQAKIDALDAKQLQVALRKSEIKLELSKVDVEVAAKQKTIDDMDDALTAMKALKSAYEGLLLGTEVTYPSLSKLVGVNPYTESYESWDPYIGEYVYVVKNKYESYINQTVEPSDIDFESEISITYLTKQLTDVEALERWKEHADFMVAYTTAQVTKAEGIYNTYCEAESPMVFAQQNAVETAQMAMELAKTQYEFYKAQFELYSKLFNEYFAAVTADDAPAEDTPADDTTTPPADGTTEGLA